MFHRALKLGIAFSVLLIPAIVSPRVALAADENNTAKVQSDIKKAVATLNDMQKLGREIDAQHGVAASGRTARRGAAVRTAAAQRTTTTPKKAAAKTNGKKAGTGAKKKKAAGQ